MTEKEIGQYNIMLLVDVSEEDVNDWVKWKYSTRVNSRKKRPRRSKRSALTGKW